MNFLCELDKARKATNAPKEMVYERGEWTIRVKLKQQ